MLEKTEYEDHFLAFLDILGFKNLIKEEDSLGLLVEVLQKIYEIKKYSNGSIQRPKINTFSDCVLISTPHHDGVDALAQLVYFCSIIHNKLFSKKIFIRGGITIGPLIHSNSIQIGPGLIDAYNLESKSAIYPRIVFSDEIIKYIDKECSFDGDHPFLRKQDADGIWFLNTFNKEYDFLSNFNANSEQYDDHVDYAEAIKHIENKLKNPELNISIRSKYYWIAKHFNENSDNKIIIPGEISERQ